LQKGINALVGLKCRIQMMVHKHAANQEYYDIPVNWRAEKEV